MNQSGKQLNNYLDIAGLVFLAAFGILFPLVFTSMTTDAFALPKQILLAVVVLISLIIFGAKMFVQGKVTLKTTPFDLPIALFILACFASALFAVNRFDALIYFVPLFFAGLLYFVMVNTLKSERAVLVMIASLVAGAVLTSVLAVLHYFKIFPIPAAYTHTQLFSPFGTLLDQAIYLGLMLPVAGYLAWPLIEPLFFQKEHHHARQGSTMQIAFAASFALMLVGLGVTLYLVFTQQRPLILPFEVGFQTAFAAISQDPTNVLKGFLLGSGLGTYLTDFTRFKQAAYNLNPNLWSFTFFRSSSFALELLATTGILGFGAYLFLIYRVVRERTFFLPLVLALVATFLLPFSFNLVIFLFLILGIFAAVRALQTPKRYPDLEFFFVALRRAGHHEGDADKNYSTYAKILPGLLFLLLLVFVGFLTYFSTRYVMADVRLQQSLVAASQNNGLATYNNQRDAIALFPYRDSTYRVFSQTNLALANSLASTQQPNLSAADQDRLRQNVLTLIQQSINAGRAAVSLSPQTALNWNNLSSIYRSLIGFGQNAEQFAVLTNQQAIALDPNNPQQYINLGGIYYQLQAWDQAQNQFQLAINLKPDYANAYYNLGHALESKGDLQNALTVYQTVRQLVASDAENVKKIDEEIKALQARIGQQANQSQNQNVQANTQDQTPLNVNTPPAQLPERDPREQIPGPPTVSPTPAGASPTQAPARR
jgi:tetratricopeptide (TPR) repeat protein